MEELRDKVSQMLREAIQPQLSIEPIPRKTFGSEWFEEEDYPLEEKEAYKERAIEYSTTDLSREHAEYNVVSNMEEEETSIPLYHPS